MNVYALHIEIVVHCAIRISVISGHIFVETISTFSSLCVAVVNEVRKNLGTVPRMEDENITEDISLGA